MNCYRKRKMIKIIAFGALVLAYIYYIYNGNTDSRKTNDIPTGISSTYNDVTATLQMVKSLSLTLGRSKSENSQNLENLEICTVDFANVNIATGKLSQSETDKIIGYTDENYDLKITMTNLDKKATCTNILWNAKRPNLPIHDCIDIKGHNWYGGPEVFSQRWPMQHDIQKMKPYLSSDTFSRTTEYGPVMERYFLTSNGLALYIDQDSPLHIGYDSFKLCLKSDYDLKYHYFNGKPLQLNYTICIANNIMEVHKALLGKLWQFPQEIPKAEVLKSPIWSTWARYKMGVTQKAVKSYTEEIIKHGFPVSHIEIDDMYTTDYGSWIWDSEKFPDPKNLTDFIHSKGFHVTTWLMPFVNADAKLFQEGIKNDYFIKAGTGIVPALVKWWQGIGAHIDFTNPKARDWFKQRLEYLKNHGIDSFKFDAGENQYLPSLFTTHKTLVNPMEFVKHYVEALREISDNSIEVRVGYQTQHVGILVRMMDKSSLWGYDNGLKTLIPSALHFGLIGYPFILPDMIAGNAYAGNTGSHDFYGDLPERELFIRWLVLTAFLPSMQFSIAPWQYDAETTQIALKYVKIHQEYVTPKIIKLAQESTQNGFPIIRPLWWLTPDDPVTFDLDSEFLIGDELLVAPIMEKGQTERNIYLPQGTWKDLRSKKTIKGPKTLKGYSIQLDEIGLFERDYNLCNSG